MDADTERMPGDAEAAGAAAGMADTYGHGLTVGDEHWFQPSVGAMPIPGRVLDVTPGHITLADRHGNEHIIHPCLLAGY
jgi:hypothetical protein